MDSLHITEEGDIFLPRPNYPGVRLGLGNQAAYSADEVRSIVREAVRRERDRCAELYGTGDVEAPIGNGSWGEAYQEGWIAGTQAYRDAIRARTKSPASS